MAGCLRALARDARGNTLAMVAAGLVPMAGVIGSGVDLSRAYMAKTRLQQACDAGVLAGRRAMGEGTYDASAQSQAQTFFNTNFPMGYLNTTSRIFTVTNPSGTSTVDGAASVTLPTVVMKLFGNDDINLSVECGAALEIANSDITMVLDTTGSMDYDIDDGTGNGTTITRLAALRAATKSFYDIVSTAAAGTGARIRYAMVPYSGTVNIGKTIYDLDPAHLVGGSVGDTYDYQSRRAVYEVNAAPLFEQIFSEDDGDLAYLTESNCNKYANNEGFNYHRVYLPNNISNNRWGPNQPSYSPGSNPATVNGNEVFYSKVSWGISGDGHPFSLFKDGNEIRKCKRQASEPDIMETYDNTVPGAVFKHWEHVQLSYNTYDYVRSIEKNAGGSYAHSAAAIPTELNGSTARWAGCIMERDTVASNDVAYSGLTGSITPGGASDLDIDAAPDSDATRWRPYWPEVSFSRSAGVATQNFSDADSNRFIWYSGGGKSQVACPSPAQLFSEMTEAQFNFYVDGLTADGGTYHDLGMLWGGRISSPDGIFSTNVTDTPTNNGFVSRHLIFMTDGTLDIGEQYYSAYGLERHDKLIGNGSEATASQNHIERFQALCDAVRAKGIRLWVVAFATSLTTEMSNCASTNSSFTSSDASQLSAAFTAIATSVADLRLSK